MSCQSFICFFKLVLGEGIEPSLVPHLGRTDYKSVDASNYINPVFFYYIGV
jgi:hypothetical protein